MALALPLIAVLTGLSNNGRFERLLRQRHHCGTCCPSGRCGRLSPRVKGRREYIPRILSLAFLPDNTLVAAGWRATDSWHGLTS